MRGSAFAFVTRLDGSRISPNSMAEAGQACWQAVLTSPSRSSRPASFASIFDRLILCVQYVHFSITPLARTVTSGFIASRRMSGVSLVKLKKLNRRTL